LWTRRAFTRKTCKTATPNILLKKRTECLFYYERCNSRYSAWVFLCISLLAKVTFKFVSCSCSTKLTRIQKTCKTAIPNIFLKKRTECLFYFERCNSRYSALVGLLCIGLLKKVTFKFVSCSCSTKLTRIQKRSKTATPNIFLKKRTECLFYFERCNSRYSALVLLLCIGLLKKVTFKFVSCSCSTKLTRIQKTSKTATPNIFLKKCTECLFYFERCNSRYSAVVLLLCIGLLIEVTFKFVSCLCSPKLTSPRGTSACRVASRAIASHSLAVL
jgi:hypothetical protein